MRIEEITLCNYCQHRGENTFKFDGDAIGIVGRNNRGKTNLVRAIQDLLTSSFCKPKERTITYGETESWVKGKISLPDGRDLEVFRGISKGKASITDLATGKELASTISSVNSMLAEIFAVDPEVISHVTFAGQEEVTKLLFSNKSARERLSQSFFGIDGAKKIEKSISGRIASLPGYDDTIETEIASVEGLIKTDREQLDLLTAELESSLKSPDFMSAEELQSARNVRFTYESSARARESIATLQGQLESKKVELSELEAKLLDEKSSIEGVDLDSAKARLERANDLSEKLNEWNRVSGALSRWENSMPDPKAIAEIQGNLTEANGRRDLILKSPTQGQVVLSIKKGLIRDANASDTGEVDCVICGSSVRADTPALIEADKSVSVDEHSQQVRQVDQEIQNLTDTHQKLVNEQTVASRQVDQLRSQLSEMEEVDSSEIEDSSKIASAIELITEAMDEIERLESEISGVKSEIQVIGSRIESLEETTSSDGVSVDEAEYDRAQVRINAHFELRSRQEQLEGAKTKCAGRIEGNENSLRMLHARAARQAKSTRQRLFLTKLRSIFHYKGAPSLIVTSRLVAIESRVNFYLELLGAQFSVKASEGLGFECLFDGKQIVSADLSGGEKVDLAVAFRIASSEGFCSSVGFVILDEPTIWLDEETKVKMGDVIERLKEMSKTDGFQFIIVTHERSLLEYFDKVIEIK